MEESKPPRSRGIGFGFVIVCIVVIGAGLYQNAEFEDRIADLRVEVSESFKVLSQETGGVKPQIQVNLDSLRRIEDDLGTQVHDMLFRQENAQAERDAALNALVETSRQLQEQVAVLLSQAETRGDQATE